MTIILKSWFGHNVVKKKKKKKLGFWQTISDIYESESDVE